MIACLVRPLHLRPWQRAPKSLPRLNIQTFQKKGKKFGKSEQIVEDRAEPQQIVATRPLYCLQHPVPIQVVCKGFTPAHICIIIHRHSRRPFRQLPIARQLWYTSTRLYFNTSHISGTNIIASSTDSGLEAFSHYPADGSFAPLPGWTEAKTNYLNQRFLSY